MSGELTGAEVFQLDMLGEDLKAAVLAARARTKDSSVMARVSETMVTVERGNPLVASDPMHHDDAIAHLVALQ